MIKYFEFFKDYHRLNVYNNVIQFVFVHLIILFGMSYLQRQKFDSLMFSTIKPYQLSTIIRT